jgi:hypothetical protein
MSRRTPAQEETPHVTGQSAGGMPQMIELAKWLVAKESKPGLTGSARP